MRYIVYTDGACSVDKNIGGCAYLILADTDFISMESIPIPGVANPTHAETIAIGLAAAYFIDSGDLSKDDVIEFNVDCQGAITFCKKYYNNVDNVRSNIKQIRASIKILRKLAGLCSIEFKWVRGHKGYSNPNMCVDRLAKLAIWRD